MKRLLLAGMLGLLCGAAWANVTVDNQLQDKKVYTQLLYEGRPHWGEIERFGAGKHAFKRNHGGRLHIWLEGYNAKHGFACAMNVKQNDTVSIRHDNNGYRCSKVTPDNT